MSIRFKFPALGLLIWLVSYSANAQEIKDGFIILPNGDYKYGNMLFKPSLNASEECFFYSETKNDYLQYTPETILGYGVINGIHFSTKEISTETGTKKYFLKKEADGIVKLYSFNDNRFFIEKEDLKELKRTGYKTLLSEALVACKSISSSIKRTAFDLKQLRELFIRYQRCTNTDTPESFDRFQFDVLAGAEFNNATLSGNSALKKNQLTDKTLLSIGFNANILVKKNRHFSWVTGVQYYKQDFYAIIRSSTSTYSSIDKINLNYHEILIPVALNYYLFKKSRSVMPYLKAGVLMPITVKSGFSWINQKEYASTVFLEQYNFPQKFKPDFLPWSISAGTTFKLISNLRNVFEISYISSGGKLKSGSTSLASSSNELTLNSSRINILLGFRF